MKGAWLTDYWQWWVALLWLAGYEIFALITGRQTLSQLYWKAQREYPWLAPIVLTGLAALVPHFMMRGPAAWTVALLLVGLIWFVYIRQHRKDGTVPAPLRNEPVVTLGLTGSGFSVAIAALIRALGYDISEAEVGAIFVVVNFIVSLIARAKSRPVDPTPEKVARDIARGDADR